MYLSHQKQMETSPDLRPGTDSRSSQGEAHHRALDTQKVGISGEINGVYGINHVLMGFYNDFMGFYSDLRGFIVYSDLMGFLGDLQNGI